MYVRVDRFMGNRTIRLCSRTDKISKNMKNFSEWIREELIAYDNAEDREYWMEKCASLEHTLRNIRENGMYWDDKRKTWRFPK
jgi:hypothetical protein